MKLFNFNLRNPFKKDEIIKQMPSVADVQFAMAPLPIIKELPGKQWVYYGNDNLYPQHLKRLVNQSPTQGAIIKGKAGMMSGDGFLINGTKSTEESDALLKTLGVDVQELYNNFTKNPNGKSSMSDINYKLCLDYQTYGAYALEVVWSMDFTKIVTLKYVEVMNIRSGKMCNNKVEEYWYSRDWNYYTKEGFIPKPIAAFDINNKQDYNQLIYVSNGTLEYYGDPHYSEGMSWVEIEGLQANFHLSNITNGFAPSMALKFYQKPGSPEEQQIIVNAIKKQYAGTGNAGRAMIFFSDGKELAPDISDIPVSNLDKQYITVNDLMKQSILTANQVTSPLLFGISTPGQLGGNTELATAYQIFNKSVIEPDRKRLEETWNMILAINKTGIQISILPFNPLVDNTLDTGNVVTKALSSISPLVATKVLEKMSDDEIRSLIGLAPNPVITTPATDTNTTPNTNTEPTA